jgi:hypothetical protein
VLLILKEKKIATTETNRSLCNSASVLGTSDELRFIHTRLTMPGSPAVEDIDFVSTMQLKRFDGTRGYWLHMSTDELLKQRGINVPTTNTTAKCHRVKQLGNERQPQ